MIALGANVDSFLGLVVKQWRNMCLLTKVDKDIKTNAKQCRTSRLNLLEDEINMHVKNRDSASQWKSTRRLSAALKGSRRHFAHAPMPQPSLKDALEHYSLPPQQGGWGAQQISCVDHLEPCFKHVIVVEDLNTQQLFDNFSKSIKYTTCRKAFPPADVPNEIWRLVLQPQWLMPNYTPRWGLGGDKLFPETKSIQHMFRRYLATFQSTKCLAIANVINICFTIPKKISSCIENGKAAQCTRSIHCYCSFTQVLLRTYRKQSNKFIPAEHMSAFGAVRFKQREEAIGIQLHNMFRCSMSGMSHLSQMFDLTNAFYCPNHESLHEYHKYFSNTINRTGEQVYHDVLENNISVIQCSDGYALLNPESGVAPGLSEATRIFNWAYERPICKFLDEAKEELDLMSAFSPVTKTWVNTALTSFVDDVCVSLVTRSHHQMPRVAENMLSKFDASIAPFGFKQNLSKACTLLRLHGVGSRTTMKEVSNIEGVNAVVHARYLGPRLHWQGRNHIEVTNRINNAWSSFHMYKSLWSSRANFKFKVCVFQATVISVLLSGLVVFVLSKTEFKRLSACYYNLLRRFDAGHACEKILDAQGKVVAHKSLSNTQVCKKLHMCSLTTELRMRRLTFLQNMLRHPKVHNMYLSSLFGQYKFEQSMPEPSANPWIKQFGHDIAACEPLDDMIFVCESVSPSLIELIESCEVRESFIAFDTKTLKAHELSNVISPWSNHVDAIDNLHVEEAAKDEFFKCDLIDGQGHVCEQSFYTHRQLVMHQQMSKKHIGQTFHLRQYVPTNQCVFCETVLSSRMAAFNHVRNAMKSGCCPVNRSYLPVPLQQMNDIYCLACEDLCFPTLHEYYVHIGRHHLVPPHIPPLPEPAAPNEPSPGYDTSSSSRHQHLHTAWQASQASRRRAETFQRVSAHSEQVGTQERAGMQMPQSHIDRRLQNGDGRQIHRSPQTRNQDLHRGSAKVARLRRFLGRSKGAVRDSERAWLQRHVRSIHKRKRAFPSANARSMRYVGYPRWLEDHTHQHQTLSGVEYVPVGTQKIGGSQPAHAHSCAAAPRHFAAGPRQSRDAIAELGLAADSAAPEEICPDFSGTARHSASWRLGETSTTVYRWVRRQNSQEIDHEPCSSTVPVPVGQESHQSNADAPSMSVPVPVCHESHQSNANAEALSVPLPASVSQCDAADASLSHVQVCHDTLPTASGDAEEPSMSTVPVQVCHESHQSHASGDADEPSMSVPVQVDQESHQLENPVQGCQDPASSNYPEQTHLNPSEAMHEYKSVFINVNIEILRQQLKCRGLETFGHREMLVDRLISHLIKHKERAESDISFCASTFPSDFSSPASNAVDVHIDSMPSLDSAPSSGEQAVFESNDSIGNGTPQGSQHDFVENTSKEVAQENRLFQYMHVQNLLDLYVESGQTPDQCTTLQQVLQITGYMLCNRAIHAFEMFVQKEWPSYCFTPPRLICDMSNTETFAKIFVKSDPMHVEQSLSQSSISPVGARPGSHDQQNTLGTARVLTRMTSAEAVRSLTDPQELTIAFASNTSLAHVEDENHARPQGDENNNDKNKGSSRTLNRMTSAEAINLL